MFPFCCNRKLPNGICLLRDQLTITTKRKHLIGYLNPGKITDKIFLIKKTGDDDRLFIYTSGVWSMDAVDGIYLHEIKKAAFQNGN